MDLDKIFGKSKEIAEKYGKKKSKSVYSPGTSLGKDIISDICRYRYKKDNLLIEYLTESFGDGSKMETLNLFEKVSPFLPKILRYFSIRDKSSQVSEMSRYTLGGNWEKRLENITIHSL